MMRQIAIFLAILMTLITVGCQNQELIQCQQDKLDLQEQLKINETKLQQTIAVYDDMFELLEKENAKLREQQTIATPPVKVQTQSQLEEDNIRLRQQLDQRTMDLLKLQQTNKALQAKIKELEKKIKK